MVFSINVEFLYGDSCVKYVTKYAMKGADLGFVRIATEGGTTVNFDEFQQIKLARFVTAHEAFMAIWGEPIVWSSKTVRRDYFIPLLFLYFRSRLFIATRKAIILKYSKMAEI